MPARTVVAVILAAAVVAPVFAGDIVAMPTGNVVKPGNIELNAIYWNQPPKSGPGDYIMVGELFVGVIDRLELDVLYADVKDVDEYTEINAYLTLIKETPKRPSLVVGVTNITEDDWLGGSKDASAFVVSSFNLACPDGPPSWTEPLVRIHAGWGDKFHGDDPIVGVQVRLDPKYGFAWTNYQRRPAYMFTYSPTKWLDLTGGTMNGGDTFYRVGGYLKW